VKRFPARESQPVMVYWACFASIAITAPLALAQWQSPTASQCLPLAAVGFTGFASQSSIIKAYRSGEASSVAPFDYTKLPIAVLAGWLLFSEAPAWATYAGGAIVIAATLYIIGRGAVVRRGRR